MSFWGLALAAGTVLALIQYAGRSTPRSRGIVAAALLRATAVALVVALLLDAPVGLRRPLAQWAALDVSASMRRGDGSVWRSALDTLRSLGAESTFVFGDSTRQPNGPTPSQPADLSSRLQSAVDRAAGGGHPLTVITDGEVDDAAAAADLPSGSRVVVMSRRAGSGGDVAVRSIDAPRSVLSGDSAEIRLTLVSGESGTPAGSVALSVDGNAVARVPFDALGAYGQAQVVVRVPLAGPPGPAVVRAVVTASSDAEPRNDTLSVVVERARGAAAVFVSTSPDYDARYAIGLLRGALAIPTRGYFRVAPGAWRLDGTLAPVTEREVRDALREAPVAIFHGDTAVFGPPRGVTMGPLALIVPPSVAEGEWYASGSPPSPLTMALSGVRWDSLPPLSVGGLEPHGAWRGVEVRRGRGDERRAIVTGEDAPRRVVIVAASGIWRWKFRAGASADAFSALWGGIFDWLAEERVDRRAVIPDAGGFRESEPIRWRRGGADSVVTATVRRRNGPSRTDSVTLKFSAGVTVVTSSPLPPGIYDVSTTGGVSAFAVNNTAEWVPARPSLKAGPTGGRAAAAELAGVRGRWGGLAYVLVILLLCTEWLVRRRIGLR